VRGLCASASRLARRAYCYPRSRSRRLDAVGDGLDLRQREPSEFLRDRQV
jgi:hypothetical protein